MYQADPDRRPGTVTTAGVVTIVLAGLTLLFGLFLLAVGASGSETFTDGFREGAGSSYDDLGDDNVNNLMFGIGVALGVWSVVAIVLAIFTMRRSNVARVLLVISSAVCVLASLISILSVISIVTLIGAIAVIVLLFVGGANAWFVAAGPAACRRPALGLTGVRPSGRLRPRPEQAVLDHLA